MLASCYSKEDEVTKEGKIILKQSTLFEFSEVQKRLSLIKLRNLEEKINSLKSKIQETNKFKQTEYFLEKPIRYKKVVEKNQNQNRESLEFVCINFQIYSAQYQRVMKSNLYFLSISTETKTFYKIGVTGRSIKERVKEINKELSIFYTNLSIFVIGIWSNYGNVEHYFKYKYRQYKTNIGKLTEYFYFQNIKPVLLDLNTLSNCQSYSPNHSIINDETINKFLLSLHIRQGMQKSKLSGIHIGRSRGETESTKKFISKPKNKAIATVLKKGLSLRQAAKETGASINTVRKQFYDNQMTLFLIHPNIERGGCVSFSRISKHAVETIIEGGLYKL